MTLARHAAPRAFMRAMRDDVLTGPASLDPVVRRAIFDYASARARGDASAQLLQPDEVRAFVDAVVRDARTADVGPLRAAGHSEERIYELAVLTAVAAGTERAQRGLLLLQSALGGLL